MNSDLDLKPDRYGNVSLHGGRTKRLLRWIEDLEYNGMTALLNSKPFSTITDWASPLYREAWRGFAESIDSDRYLLPQRGEWLDVDALLEPLLPIPSLPTIRESSNSGEKNALQERVEAKQRSFEEIFNSELVRLNGLRLRDRYVNEEPESVATLIELANRRHPIGRRFRDNFHAFIDPNAKVVLILQHGLLAERIANVGVSEETSQRQQRLLRASPTIRSRKTSRIHDALYEYRIGKYERQWANQPNGKTDSAS